MGFSRQEWVAVSFSREYSQGSNLCLLYLPHWRAGSLSLVTPAVPCLLLCLVAQSCLTFCNPTDCSQPGSSVHGDSPGKNTGVGCHALFQVPPGKPQIMTYVKVKIVQPCPTLCDVHGILQARILVCAACSLLQGIFPTPGLNPGLPHCGRVLSQLSHQGSPIIT